LQTRFIVNPRAGAARAAADAVRAAAARLGATVEFTTGPRHASTLAAQAIADGCGLIVAVGGDGTLNEVASRLVGTSAILGLVPCGSGNGLGRHLGVHGSVRRSLHLLSSGKPRRIDTGIVDGHPFFTVAGLGFEAEVSAAFNLLSTRGFFRYLGTAARLWRQHRSEDCRIEADGRHFSARLFTLAVANTDQYGNRARISPGARIDDGLLDLTVIPSVSLGQAVPLLTRLFTGTIAGGRGVQRAQAARIAIERSRPGLIHTDGEIHAAGLRIEFSVLPGSLSVLAPTEPTSR